MYFLDEMSYEEVQAVLNAQDDIFINSWEQVRFLAFVQATAAGVKLRKATDLIKFDWDSDIVAEEISAEELQQRKQSMLDFIQNTKTFKEFNPLLS